MKSRLEPQHKRWNSKSKGPKLNKEALMHAAPLNVHHMSTRQKAQTKAEASAAPRVHHLRPNHHHGSALAALCWVARRPLPE